MRYRRFIIQLLSLLFILLLAEVEAKEPLETIYCQRLGDEISEQIPEGSCDGFLYDYQNNPPSYTIDQYIDAYKEVIGESRTQKVEASYQRLREKILNIFVDYSNHKNDEKMQASVNSSFEEYSDAFLRIFPTNGKLKGEFLNILTIMSRYQEETLFQGASHTEILSVIHALYGATRGYYVKSIPAADKVINSLTNREGKKVTREYLDRKIFQALIKSVYEDIDTSQVKSLLSSEWLLNNISELRTGKVLELGAGYGSRASQLSDLGADIIATDLNKPVVNYSKHVIPMGAVSAVKQYQDRNVIFIENPVWNPMWSGHARPVDNMPESESIIPHLNLSEGATIIVVLHDTPTLAKFQQVLNQKAWLMPGAQGHPLWTFEKYRSVADSYMGIEVLEAPSELFLYYDKTQQSPYKKLSVLIVRISPSFCYADGTCRS